MNNYLKLFENIYAPDRPKATTDTFYHRKFKRFNTTRYDIVSSCIKGGDLLLDLGCLDGDLIFMQKGKFKKYYGVDIVYNRIRKAKKLAEEREIQAEFILYDLNNMPFPFKDNTFDVVTCIALLPYIFSLEDFFREVTRILKINGKFIFQVPNLGYLPRRLSLFFGRIPSQMFSPPGMIQFFIKKRCLELIYHVGLKIEKISGSGLFASLRNWYPSVLTGDLIFDTAKKDIGSNG